MKKLLLILVSALMIGQSISASQSSHSQLTPQGFKTQKKVKSQDVIVGFDTPDTSGATPLIYATMRGNLEKVTQLVQSGARINHLDHQNWTPLHYAITYDHPAITHYLLGNGAEINHEAYKSNPILVLAAKSKNTQHLRLLLKNRLIPMWELNRALRFATQHKRNLNVSLLLHAGAYANTCDKNSVTPLIRAALHDDSETVSILLNYGADLLHRDSQNNTAIMVALKNGFRSLANVITQAKLFCEKPLSSIKKGKNLKQLLIWSIAYKKNQAYQEIKKLKPDWFSNPVAVAKLFLHAARVGNGSVVADLGSLLESLKVPSMPQLYLQAIQYLASYPDCQDAVHQICAEKISPEL